ncbi:MAG: proline racemase family protein, partial [Vicinamibacterales bacterium]
MKTIDAHVGGAPLRLLVDGVPRPSGKTMAQKRDWMKRHADELRRQVILEPRGHADMIGALFTEPVSPGADAGLLFMDVGGYIALSGHGVMAAVTIAIERGLLLSCEKGDQMTFDTPTGTVYARARVQSHGETRRVDSVVLVNVPSFVVTGGQVVRLGARDLRVDIAFGGVFYAMVDTEAIGISLEGERLPELRRVAAQIRDAVNGGGAVAHPGDRRMSGIAGVVFTGPPRDPEAHLRSVVVSESGVIDRSPSATGTSAVMAVLDAMGLLQEDVPFVHESLVGSLHRA